MKRIIAATLALAALGACGDGNPFTDPTDTDGGTTVTTTEVPESITSALVDFSYDATADTLTISGLTNDGDTNPVTFRRRAALDRGPYSAFTLQDDALDEHTTVYVRELGNVTGATATTGGQFRFFSGGALFQRTGAYDPIVPSEANDRGLVTYAGRYVGLTDVNGPRTDLLTPPATVTDPTVIPAQAGVVTADIIINVEFSANTLKGEIFNRSVETETRGTVTVTPDLLLEPTTLAGDGTFAGEVITDDANEADVGEYAGIIGGTDSSELAGSIYVSEHFGDDPSVATITGEEEFGTFVLGRCGGPNADAGVAACTGVDPE